MDNADDEMQEVFEKAAELFAVLSTPIRLRIISELCQGEKNVGQLHERIGVTQPNMSQHLNLLYRAGLLASALWRRSCPMRPSARRGSSPVGAAA